MERRPLPPASVSIGGIKANQGCPAPGELAKSKRANGKEGQPIDTLRPSEEAESQQSPRSGRGLLHLFPDAVIDQLGDVFSARLWL